MNLIVAKEHFSENVIMLEIEAPRIAKARKAGHFVIVRVDKNGERVPLTIAGSNIEKGTITLVVQRIGVSTWKLTNLNVGDYVEDIVGPLGRATQIEKQDGTVLCAGGGVGVAPLLPIIQAHHEAGNRVVAVLAGRTKELIILEDQVRKYADDVVIMTDDGSYGTKGLVTTGMEEVINREKVAEAVVIGPAIMMKFGALTTKKYTGMCGACRVSVGGKTRFVCVDGPEFNAHEVDFDEMLKRMGGFKAEEQAAFAAYKEACGMN